MKDKIKGVTTFCDWPSGASQKEKIGGVTNPSIEKIVSLNPDLILATADGNRKETVRQLERLGLPVYVINPSDIEGVLKSISHIGEITDQKPETEMAVAALQQRLNKIAIQTKGKKKPRVFFQIGFEPVITAGKGTLINEAIGWAGGINVAEQSTARYPRYSTEGIAASAPDIILFRSDERQYRIPRKKNILGKIRNNTGGKKRKDLFYRHGFNQPRLTAHRRRHRTDGTAISSGDKIKAES